MVFMRSVRAAKEKEKMRNGQIGHGWKSDRGRASEDYAKYRDICPERFFKRSGNRDGGIFRHLCRYGAHFTGVDISENRIEQARRLTEEAEGNGA